MYIHSQNIYKTVINFAYKKICLAEQFLGVPLLSWPLALAAPHMSVLKTPYQTCHSFLYLLRPRQRKRQPTKLGTLYVGFVWKNIAKMPIKFK